MQYGQIVVLLTLVFAAYYAVMIVMDLQKARAAQAAEAENAQEEDIDISDEAKLFSPVKVSRDTKPKTQVVDNDESNNAEQSDEAETSGQQDEQQDEHQGQSGSEQQTEEKPRRPNYREPIMTDGILIETLVEEISDLAETGKCDLGAVIYKCENAI